VKVGDPHDRLAGKEMNMNGSCCTTSDGMGRTAVFAAPMLGTLFADAFRGPTFGDSGREVTRDGGTMAVDVIEEPTALIVRALVPGYGKDQIDASMEEGVLSISTRACECAETTGKVYRREIRCAPMQRRLRLPFAVVEEQIKGELRDGVLTLTLPKVPEAQPRRIPIEG
jgi:HSP20 family protein